MQTRAVAVHCGRSCCCQRAVIDLFSVLAFAAVSSNDLYDVHIANTAMETNRNGFQWWFNSKRANEDNCDSNFTINFLLNTKRPPLQFVITSKFLLWMCFQLSHMFVFIDACCTRIPNESLKFITTLSLKYFSLLSFVDGEKLHFGVAWSRLFSWW